jgi:hypothetical protein
MASRKTGSCMLRRKSKARLQDGGCISSFTTSLSPLSFYYYHFIGENVSLMFFVV